MDARLESILIECLDALERGESVDTILARYPDEAGQLSAMLTAASRLPALQMAPAHGAEQRSRRAFVAAAAKMRAEAGARRRVPFAFPALQVMAILLLALGMGGMLFIAASSNTLPGDSLYGARRGLENLRLLLASQERADDLRAEYEQRRIAEIERLLAEGREAEVAFVGAIQAIGPEVWLISGLQVEVTGETVIDFTPAAGLRVIVRGYTQDGKLIALTIELEPGQQASDDTPLSTPDVQASPTPTTIQPADTPVLTATATPDATVAPGTASPTPTSPPTFTPEPTSSPPEDDEGDGDGDEEEGGDDGEGED